MDYTGVIIEESLADKSLLDDLHILSTKVEQVTPEHQTPWLTQWTLHTIQIPEDRADEIAKKLRTSFDPEHPDWYVDFKNDHFHYVIFENKIFKVDLSNPVLYKNVKAYGLSRGIPDYQLDFAPEDVMWKR